MSSGFIPKKKLNELLNLKKNLKYLPVMHEFRKTSAQMIETCGKMRLRMDKSIITAQHTCLKVNRCLPLLNPAGKGMFEQYDDEKGPLRSLSHSSVL